MNVGSVGGLQALWTFQTNGTGTNRTVVTQPVVAGGTVYVGAWNGYEYALNESTGIPRWSTYLGQDADPNCTPVYRGITSTAAVVGSNVYVGGGDSYWYVLNAANGSLRWRVLVGNISAGFYNWASPAVYGGAAYVGAASTCDNPLVRGAVYEVNLGAHFIARTFYAVPIGLRGGGVWSSPALDPATNTLYVTTGNGPSPALKLTDAIVALNATSLNLSSSWQVPVGQQIVDGDMGSGATVAYDDRGTPLVVAVDKNGLAYAWNASNVSLGPRWTDTVGVPSGCPECGNASIAPAAFDGTRLYFGTARVTIGGINDSGSLDAVDPGTGAFLWRHVTPGPVLGAMTVSAGLVLVAAGSELQVLDAANGSLLFQTSLPGPAWSAPSIADGCVFQATTNGTVSAFGLPGSGCLAPAATSWVPLPQTSSPSPRDRSASVFDGALRSVVLFGGRGASGALGDTWEFRNGNWTPVATATAPSPRWGAALSYDPSTGNVVLFGGTNGTAIFGDTWVFNGTWSNLTGSLFVAPSARIGAALGYDQVVATIVLFGGWNDSGALSDTWEFSNGVWLPESMTVAPPPRSNATLSRETANGSLFLAGGVNGSQTLGDLWRFAGTTWTPLAPAAAPPLRRNATASIDGEIPALILFGGDGPVAGARSTLGDTWALSQGQWLPSSPLVSPRARSAGTSAFDARDHYLVLFGGNTAGPGAPPAFAGDTWAYAPALVGNVSANRTIVDAGGSVGFSVNLAGGFGLVTPTWTFGDGGRVIGRSQPSHVFTSAGTYLVHLWANDSVDQSLALALTITVGAALNVSLVASAKSVDTGQTVFFNTTPNGGSPPFGYAYTNLPFGCVSSSTASLACQPTLNGTSFTRANVTDAAGVTFAAGPVKVRVYLAPQLSAFTLSSSRTDAAVPVAFDLTVANGVGPFRVTYHNLPSPCADTSVGAWNCTPGSPGAGPATYPVSATIVDANGAMIGTPTLNLTVYPAFLVTPSVAPSNVTLGSGSNFSNVWWNVTASGGDPPYNAVLRPGGLPLQCRSGNATILASGGTFVTECAPKAVGTYNATFAVTDQLGIREVVVTENLIVRPAAPVGGGGGATNTTKTGFLGGHALVYAAIGLVAFLVVLELLLLLRQRRRRASAHRPPPSDVSEPPT